MRESWGQSKHWLSVTNGWSLGQEAGRIQMTSRLQ